MISQTRDTAANDVWAGLLDWPLWVRLGWYDVVSRYRRSWIGPLWLIATTIIFVVSLGTVYSVIFNVSIKDYMPFVALGTVIWSYISAVSGESLQTFVEAEVYIRQVRRSPIIYTCRVVWRNLIIFMNQFIVAVIVALIFNKVSLFSIPFALIGVFLLALQGAWLSMLLGILGTRFRDLAQIVQNLLQIAFFITPVLWPASVLGSNRWIAEVNPLYHLMQIVRGPILGEIPSWTSYGVVAGLTVVGFTSAFVFYNKFRQRIVYWL